MLAPFPPTFNATDRLRLLKPTSYAFSNSVAKEFAATFHATFYASVEGSQLKLLSQEKKGRFWPDRIS